MPNDTKKTRKTSGASQNSNKRQRTAPSRASASIPSAAAPCIFMPPVHLARLQPELAFVTPKRSRVTGGGSSHLRAAAHTDASPVSVPETALAAAPDVLVSSAAASQVQQVSMGGSSHGPRPNAGCTGLGTVSTAHIPAKALQCDTRLLLTVISGDIVRVNHWINAGVNLHEKYPKGNVLDYAITCELEQHQKDAVISTIFLAGFNVFSTVVSPRILEEIARRGLNNRDILAGIGIYKKYMPMPFGYNEVGNEILGTAARGDRFSQRIFNAYPRPALQRWITAPIEVSDQQIWMNIAQIACVYQARWRSQEAFDRAIIQSRVESTPPPSWSQQGSWSPLLMRTPHGSYQSSSFVSASSNSGSSSQSVIGYRSLSVSRQFIDSRASQDSDTPAVIFRRP